MMVNGLVVERIAGARAEEQILHLRGALTLNNLFDFQTAVRSETHKIQIIDFTDVNYVDSAGVGSLIGGFIAAQKAGRRMILVGLNERVRVLLQMTNVATLFPTYETLSQAEAALI
jgi:anti-sigma B factor antagonist